MEKPSILIIDDSPVMSRFLAIFLEKKYQVTTFSDSLEALNALQNGLSPMAIITDLDMPNLHGLDFIKHVRTSGNSAPILVVSGNKESNTRIQCLELGADDYLTKPFHPAELDMRITKLLNRVVPITAEVEEVVENPLPVRSIFKEFIKAAAF